MRDSIDAEGVQELAALYRKLPSLVWEAAIAVRPDDTGKLDGPWLRKFRDAEIRISQIVDRIRQIAEA